MAVVCLILVNAFSVKEILGQPVLPPSSEVAPRDAPMQHMAQRWILCVAECFLVIKA